MRMVPDVDLARLERSIKQHEGFRPHAYIDPLGYLTIGYGRMIDEKLGGGISESEATYLLRNDIQRIVHELRAQPLIEGLGAVRFEVLVEMAFNLGMNGLLKFKKMRRALRDGDYAKAAEEMLDSRWARQVGNRAKELAWRMEHGRYREA